MNAIVDNLEALLADAHKTKGWQWVQEPLWTTWSLEKFGKIEAFFILLYRYVLGTDAGTFFSPVTSVPDILIPYHRSLIMHTELVDTLRSHQVTFDVSRQAVAQWAAQPYLEEGVWESQWEDLCAVEIERWNSRK